MPNTKEKVFKDILSIVGVIGLISLSLLAPNALQIFGSKYTRNTRTRERIKKSLKRLEKRGFVSIKQNGDKTVITLTKNGKRKILEYKIDEMHIKKPKKWDGKWRLVIFDVPNSKSSNRLAFTRKLKDLGFKYLQKSVWVLPYPCEDQVDLIKEVYEIEPYVTVVRADSIDISADLKKYFSL